MYSRQTKVINKSGLHARPASDFIAAASGFCSDIRISRADQPAAAVNAKSMILLLSLSVGQGMDITIFAEGADEKAAVDTLAALVDSGFGEDCGCTER